MSAIKDDSIKDDSTTPILIEKSKENKFKTVNKIQGSVGDLVGGGNIEKIRDILFGAQAREYELKLIRIEERMLKELNDLREETRKRSDSLENYIKKELETLNDRLNFEQGELKDTANSLEKKIKQADEHANKNARDLRQEILDQFKMLSDEIRKKHDESTSSLEQVADELRNNKISRSLLSELFNEIAMRLSNDKIMELNLELNKSNDE